MGGRLFSLLLFAVVFLALLPAQDAKEETEDSVYQRAMALDLRTATYFELVAWCERLGLSARGSRTELQRRLEEHYGLPRQTATPGEEGGREIEIESADGSRYYDIDEPPEKYLQLFGNVVLVLLDDENDTVHRITSDRIIYNQTINSITAAGNLTYVLEQESGTETFTGESLTVNLDDWQGVFISGTSKTERTVDEEKLIFFYTGKTIYRLADDTVIMKQGNITSSPAANPYYHIDADRIWVLGPGEWALRNAVLYVGRVPLFYFPFFFYPGNELRMHPATGYRDIGGYYLQLTGYIVGKREKSDDSLSFLQVTDEGDSSYRTEPWGIYLQKIRTEGGEEAKEETKDYIKVLFDIYSRLGFYGGIAGEIDPEEVFESVTFDIGVARSRDVFPGAGGVYTYLRRNEEGEYVSRWNNSHFLGVELPVRFGGNFETSIKTPSLTMGVEFPVYSDPWFRRDFSDREERIDWAALIGVEEEEETGQASTTAAPPGKIDRFAWQLNGRFNPQVTDLRPYVQSLSLSKAAASINWRSKALPSGELPYAIGPAEYQYPEREFFVPESYILPSLAGRISGSLIGAAKEKTAETRKTAPGTDDGLEIKPPWSDETIDEEKAKESVEEELTIPSIQEDLKLRRPPALQETRHTLTYSLSPDFSIDSRYNNAGWIYPSDIDFTTQYSVLSTRANGGIQYSSNFFGTLLGVRDNLSISAVYRNHYGGSPESVPNWDSYVKQDKQASYFRLTDGIDLTLLPLLGAERLSKSSIQYGLTSILYQHTYNAELEEYEDRTLEWDKEIVTAHNLKMNAVYGLSFGDQKVALTAVLPPLNEVLTYTLTSTVGPVQTTLASGVRKESDGDNDNQESDAEQWKLDDLTWTEKFSFPQKSYFENKLTYSLEENDLALNSSTVSLSGLEGKLTFSETFTYNFAEDEPQSSILSLKLHWFTLQLQAAQSVRYTLVDDPAAPGRKKYEAGEKGFIPTQFVTAFKYDLAGEKFWRDRISVSGSIDTSWALNLVRATDSSMSFGLKLDLEIAEFLKLSISSKSTNKASYRYIPVLSDSLGLDWLNPVVDIARSFNFFNRQDRVRSFFNLDNISINVTHPMPDWELEIDYSGTPELREEEGSTFYKWVGEASILVRWRPIPEIKRKVTSKEGEVSF
ncbi:MAG: hypothetical protein JW852_05620 [Spirochaetales bacterium]|nr:hypothetical protein [Spirochaetales bacterium]